MEIILVSGGKGGIAKSTTSIFLADLLLRQKKDFFGIEGEGASKQATFSKQLRQNLGDETFKKIFDGFDLTKEEGYIALARKIQFLKTNGFSGKVVVDTGASMVDSLVKNANIFNKILEKLKVEWKIVFLVSPLVDSAEHAKYFYEKIKQFPKIKHIFLKFEQMPDQTRGVYAIDEKSYGFSKIKSELNAIELVMPLMHNEVMHKFLNEKLMPFKQVADDADIVSQVLLEENLIPTDEVLNKILDA